MKNLINVLAVVLVIGFASCEKYEPLVSEQAQNGMPEVNVYDWKIYPDSISCKVHSINPEYDYINTVHGMPVLHVNSKEQGLLSMTINRGDFDTLKGGKVYYFSMEINLNHENLKDIEAYFNFEHKYSTK